MLNFDEDFKHFQTDTADLLVLFQNKQNLKKLGIDVDGDDTVFGAKFVYCNAHRVAHSTGWCTVRIANKRPLNAETNTEAHAEVLALGYEIYNPSGTLHFKL